MKFRRFLMLASVVLSSAFPSLATDFRASSADYTCDADHTLDNELWISARTITIKGRAMDDLFLFAEASTARAATNLPSTVRVEGLARGSVWAAGESVETSGVIERHARLLGFRYVQVGGRVNRNLIALGSTISLPPSASIAGDSLLAARQVVVEGSVEGDTRIYAESITLSGNFTGNVALVAATINIMPGTHIGGDLHYRSDRELILDSKVSLHGKLIRDSVPPPTPRKSSPEDYVLQLALWAASLLTGLVFVTLFPGFAGLSLHRLKDSFWKCLLIGFAAGCLIPMASVFLFVTVIGIPLGILALFAYVILIYLGKIVAALYLGHLMIVRHSNPPVIRLLPLLAFGLMAIYIAALLPFPIDILIWFSFTLMGMGAIVGAILDRRTPVMVTIPGEEPPPAPPPLPGATP